MKKLSFLLLLAIFTPNLHSNGALRVLATRTAQMARPVLARRTPVAARAVTPIKATVPTRISATIATTSAPIKTNSFPFLIGAVTVTGIGIPAGLNIYSSAKDNKSRFNLTRATERVMIQNDAVKAEQVIPQKTLNEIRQAYVKVLGHDANVQFYVGSLGSKSTINAYTAGMPSSRPVVFIEKCLLRENLNYFKFVIGHEAAHDKEAHRLINKVAKQVLYAEFIISLGLAALKANSEKDLWLKLFPRTAIKVPIYVLLLRQLSQKLESRADLRSLKKLGPNIAKSVLHRAEDTIRFLRNKRKKDLENLNDEGLLIYSVQKILNRIYHTPSARRKKTINIKKLYERG